MKTRLLVIAVGVFALLLSFSARVNAQSNDRIGETWKGPNSSLIMSVLKSRKPSSTESNAKPRSDTISFKPSGDSGVGRSLADALGRNAEEKAALIEAFGQIKQGYEAEVAKVGKSNNLAAAMTFFITANVAAFHQTEIASDEAAETIFRSLQETMAGLPAVAQMSNVEKQQMHDWLVSMAGFVMAGSTEARKIGDKEALNNFSELAGYSLRLVLGVDAGQIKITGSNLAIEDVSPQPPGSTESKIVGVWSKSASSPTGMAGTIDGTEKLMTNAGYYKGQYQFNPDGTYAFKGESWGGYLRSNEFWTTEESGAYSVSGDTLTIAPRASKKTLRNRAGVVQTSMNNPLEKVTYKWRLHYFEGLNETQLVLQAAKENLRDGGFSGNSNFPNSFLYSSSRNMEWRF